MTSVFQWFISLKLALITRVLVLRVLVQKKAFYIFTLKAMAPEGLNNELDFSRVFVNFFSVNNNNPDSLNQFRKFI